MISFIIIGRNEGWRLKMCLESVCAAIQQYKLDAEIIYVDSQSSDDSLKMTASYPQVKTYLITGVCNAAIARNIGAKEASGENFVFLDGDMEICADFIPLIFDEKQALKFEFVSGNFMNYYYDHSWKFISKDYYRKVYCSEDSYQYTTGGLFAIKRIHWESVGGMKPKFKKGQDLDLGYRLAKKGVFLLRKKEQMANHHTIDYKNEKRLWNSFTDGTYVYPRAVLYRDHLLNKYVISRFISSDPTLGVLVICSVFSLVLGQPLIMPVYLILTLLAVLYSMRKTGFNGVFNRFFNHILRDLMNVMAFILFYPSNRIELNYKRV